MIKVTKRLIEAVTEAGLLPKPQRNSFMPCLILFTVFASAMDFDTFYRGPIVTGELRTGIMYSIGLTNRLCKQVSNRHVSVSDRQDV
jgi:hypothetical protein